MLGARFFYSLALWLLLPYIFLRLLWRARKQPEYLRHIGERFGFYTVSSAQPVIWLHAVSVGETRATQSLVTRLSKVYPQHQILLTHTTPTGRATGEQLYGDSVLRAYLPYDYPFAVNKFLRHFQPQLGILMETEIWFNMIHACRETSTPLLLLNARMSEKSAHNYARVAQLTRNALGELAAIAAQTADDAARLADLGAQNVSVTGNLKFDIEPPQAMLQLGKQLREQFGTGRKVFLAASTREGEEALLLDALKNIHIPGLLLVIVPRHPQRFTEVAALLEQRSISFQRRTEIGRAGEQQANGYGKDATPDNETRHTRFPLSNFPPQAGERANGSLREFHVNAVRADEISAEIQVVLGDSMGEMFAYYAAADLAFIGGSLLPYGGQNLIEACAVGTPVLIGPHTQNFAEATRLAVAAGAAAQVADSGELVMELQRLLDNPDALREMHQRCAGFVEYNRGATDKSLQIILSLLAIPPAV